MQLDLQKLDSSTSIAKTVLKRQRHVISKLSTRGGVLLGLLCDNQVCDRDIFGAMEDQVGSRARLIEIVNVKNAARADGTSLKYRDVITGATRCQAVKATTVCHRTSAPQAVVDLHSFEFI